MIFYIVLFIIGFVTGIILTAVITSIINKHSSFGDLVINTDDPLKDVFSFEFSRHPDEMLNKQRVIFKVTKSQ